MSRLLTDAERSRLVRGAELAAENAEEAETEADRRRFLDERRRLMASLEADNVRRGAAL